MNTISLNTLMRVISRVDDTNEDNFDTFKEELSRICTSLTDDDLEDITTFLDDMGVMNDNEVIDLIDYEIEQLYDFINNIYS